LRKGKFEWGDALKWDKMQVGFSKSLKVGIVKLYDVDLKFTRKKQLGLLIGWLMSK